MILDQLDQVAVLRMHNGKANALDPELLVWLDGMLVRLADEEHRALVLTGYERFFCAGLDLVTLAAFDREEMLGFMRLFQRVVLRLFEHSRPVIAAVNGHAVAGGCVLALLADWRVGVDAGSKMGLNETRLGVGLPTAAATALACVLPAPSLARTALFGELHEGQAALTLGLLHELVPAAQVFERAMSRARDLAKIPTAAWAQVKHELRGAAAEAAHATNAADEDRWLDTWFSPEACALRAAAVDKLLAGKR